MYVAQVNLWRQGLQPWLSLRMAAWTQWIHHQIHCIYRIHCIHRIHQCGIQPMSILSAGPERKNLAQNLAICSMFCKLVPFEFVMKNIDI